MKIKIIKVEDNEFVEGEIIEARKLNVVLPSITDGWRFNFKKHSKNKDAQVFVLIIDGNNRIEGCLIFEMKDKVEPYMAFIEVAPHNRGDKKEFESIAGCLIAYACKLSFVYGKKWYTGWLAFDVQEETEESTLQLMAIYSKKYRAQRFADTTIMLISPEDGEWLINEYLKTE
ncbi:hypothetical protein [Chryseobacterium pennipullorum]|uniref:N-acetyltransferase n=1 Tax=Chryseobacterium pennipullorum TaxID=2258963 RepID=A0A3D9B9L6_9FLAO|nr:hypothetical protein [Chryseobacterium pennipullorum]REC50253.1 hypothetical protein DRF67_01620 [Chryseobacterium pennipullorum]